MATLRSYLLLLSSLLLTVTLPKDLCHSIEVMLLIMFQAVLCKCKRPIYKALSLSGSDSSWDADSFSPQDLFFKTLIGI